MRIVDCSAGCDAIEEWVVDVLPVVELHHFSLQGTSGPQKAFELVARNCIHAGVVHARTMRPEGAVDGRVHGRGARMRLGDVPLDAPICVSVNGVVLESPTLSELQLVGLRGPLATVTWLAPSLAAQATAAADAGADGSWRSEICNGDLILAATPGALIPVEAGSEVRVFWLGMEATCTLLGAAHSNSNSKL